MGPISKILEGPGPPGTPRIDASDYGSLLFKLFGVDEQRDVYSTSNLSTVQYSTEMSESPIYSDMDFSLIPIN